VQWTIVNPFLFLLFFPLAASPDAQLVEWSGVSIAGFSFPPAPGPGRGQRRSDFPVETSARLFPPPQARKFSRLSGEQGTIGGVAQISHFPPCSPLLLTPRWTFLGADFPFFFPPFFSFLSPLPGSRITAVIGGFFSFFSFLLFSGWSGLMTSHGPPPTPNNLPFGGCPFFFPLFLPLPPREIDGLKISL